MWEGQRVSVVFPAYNDVANIARAACDFQSTSAVDEVHIVDDNSQNGTGGLARQVAA